MNSVLGNLEHFSIQERLTMIQTIWDSIESSQQPIPLTKAQKDDLDRRLDYHQAHPEDVISWEDLRHSIEHED